MKIRNIVLFVLSVLAVSPAYPAQRPLAICFKPHDHAYVISCDSQDFLRVTFAPQLGVDEYYLHPAKGHTLWTDEDNELEITQSMPSAELDSDALGEGLGEHTREVLGRTDVKPILFALKNKLGQQICGAVGAFLFGGFALFQASFLDRDPQTFIFFMQHIEQFVLKKGVNKIYVQIADKYKRLRSLFLTCGYVIKNTGRDLVAGGSCYNLCKHLKPIAIKNQIYSIHTAWLPIGSKEEQKKVIDEFFSGQIKQKIEKEEFVPDAKVFCTVGVFVRNKDGKVIGGCFGKISKESKIRHLHIDMVWLHKSLRGKKLSRIFLSFIEAIAKDHGCVYSELGTADYFCPGLYRKLGYVADIIMKDIFYYADGRPCTNYRFQKRLVPRSILYTL